MRIACNSRTIRAAAAQCMAVFGAQILRRCLMLAAAGVLLATTLTASHPAGANAGSPTPIPSLADAADGGAALASADRARAGKLTVDGWQSERRDHDRFRLASWRGRRRACRLELAGQLHHSSKLHAAGESRRGRPGSLHGSGERRRHARGQLTESNECRQGGHQRHPEFIHAVCRFRADGLLDRESRRVHHLGVLHERAGRLHFHQHTRRQPLRQQPVLQRQHGKPGRRMLRRATPC